MTERSEVERLVRNLYELRRQEDIDGIIEGFTPDATFRLAGDLAPLTTEVCGHPALRVMISELARAWDWRGYKIATVLVDGDRVAVHSRGEMLYVPTGTPVRTETLDILTLKDGKVAEFVQFCDTHMASKVMKIAA